MTHPCPIHRCPHDVADAHLLCGAHWRLLCGAHWRLLPAELRSELYRTWRAARRTGMRTDAGSQSLRADYRRVRQACIDHINALQEAA